MKHCVLHFRSVGMGVSGSFLANLSYFNFIRAKNGVVVLLKIQKYTYDTPLSEKEAKLLLRVLGRSSRNT